ncbi:MAG: XrtA system polysaccharide chain length determinant [Nitrospirota bacterium]
MNSDTSQNEIKHYWYTVLRRKYLFIWVSLIVLSIVVWGSFFIPEKYEAKSTVFIEQSAIRQLIEGNRMRYREGVLRGLRYTMLSRKVLISVAREMDFDVTDENKMEMLIGKFSKNTTITASTKENLFRVSYKGKDPDAVQEYVNTLVEKYIEMILSAKKDDAYGASMFLSEQIDYYKKKIAEIEGRLADFRRDEGIYLAIDEGSLVNSIKTYQEEIENVEMEMKKFEAKKKKMKQQLSGESAYTLAMIDSGGGNSLPARLKTLEHKLQILLTNYTENYPEVIRVKMEIETLKKQIKVKTEDGDADGNLNSDLSSGMSMMNPIYQQLKEDLFSVESEIDSLTAKKGTLLNRIKRNESELKNIPESKKILTNLERDKNTYQTLYKQMLSKLGQAEVNEQVEAQNKGETYKIIERAVFPRRPVSPDRVKMILFGILAGIAAGFGAVLFMEKNDSSIRNVDTLKSQFGLKVLAVIPSIVTENDLRRKQKLDKSVYAFSVFYLFIIGGVLVRELLDRFFLVK